MSINPVRDTPVLLSHIIMNISGEYQNLAKSGESTEALFRRIRVFYKVLKQIESVVPQDKGRASYL